MLLLHRKNGTSSKLNSIYSVYIVTNHFTNDLCISMLCMDVGKDFICYFVKMNEKKVNSARPQVRQQAVASMIDVKHLCTLVVVKWYWFAISVFLCLLIAGVYLWRTPKVVSVTGKMEIIDKSKKGSGLSAGMAMLNSLPMGLGSALGGSVGGSLGIDSEKEILTSNILVRNVVKDLGLYTEYRLSKWGRKKLLYQDQPVTVTLDPAHVAWLDSELPLNVHKIRLTITKDNSGYTVSTMVKNNNESNKLLDQSFASLPATIKTEAGVLTITENVNVPEKQKQLYADDYKLIVSINPPMESAETFIKNLVVDPPSKKVTNILGITISDENALRGIDFVNNLVVAYNQRANDDKNEEARKTDEFVNARLARVDAELGSSDADWERYKKQFQITEPEVDAQEVMTKKSMYETELVEIGTQLQLHDYLSEYVNDPANLYEIIPVSMSVGSSIGKKGGDNGSAAMQSTSLIAQHNDLVTQRKEYLKSMSDKAPQVQRLTESIQELHPVIKTAMKRDRQSILLKRSNVEREYGRYMGRVGSAPQQERVLTEIGRQREIKQGVYLVMLQKREETAMELANVADKGKLIETTTTVKGSAKPQLKMVLIFALLMGIILPLVLVIVIQIFKETVDTKKDIEAIVKSPIVGEIPLSGQNEAIRNLRTNLLLGLEEGQKVIMLVSDADGDGKTYLAKFLTDSLSAIGKKVFYFNADFRGLNGGQHPADIIASSDFANQMATAKANNDYVIIDTPSLGKYNDAYQLSTFADATCYVIKVGATSKSSVAKIEKDSHLPNVRFILNAIDMTKKINKYFFKNLLTLISATLILSACGSSEKIAYLQNSDKVNTEPSKVLFDARIMPKDILTVSVSTINSEAAIPFNLTIPTTVSQSKDKNLTSQPVLQDYLVANDGTIDFPIVGKIKVSGLTKTECEAMILDKIRPYLADTEKPIVAVRMSSYSISVLGEVKNPGSFQVSREKINIFEALAQAGDMTIYGVRDRVRLIREDASGKKDIHILDLTDANIINSPYYYLQQNDIVYVEPSNIKKQDARVGSMTTLWFSATSILVSVASLLVNILR